MNDPIDFVISMVSPHYAAYIPASELTGPPPTFPPVIQPLDTGARVLVRHMVGRRDSGPLWRIDNLEAPTRADVMGEFLGYIPFVRSVPLVGPGLVLAVVETDGGLLLCLPDDMEAAG